MSQTLSVNTPTPFKDTLLYILLIFIVTRLFLIAGVYGTRAMGVEVIDYVPEITNRIEFLDPLLLWDSQWYLKIAQHGYDYDLEGTWGDNTIAFFPLYPLLIRLLSSISGIHPILTALLISNLTAIIGLYYLYRLQELWFGSDCAKQTIIALLFYPFSFILSVPYTESLFIALTFAAIYASYQKNWLQAACLAGISSACRMHGILLIIIIAYEWACSHGWSLKHIHKLETWKNLVKGFKQEPLTVLAIAFIPFVGLILFMTYQLKTYQDAFAFIHANNTIWGSLQVNPLIHLVNIVQSFFNIRWYEIFIVIEFWGILTILFGIFWAVYAAYKYHIGYTLYILVSIYVTIPRVWGMMRYIIALAPIFLVIGYFLYKHPRLQIIYVVIGAMGIVTLSFAFSNFFFVG